MNFLGILEATVASRDTYCWDFSRYGILDSIRILYQEPKTHLDFRKSKLRFKSQFPLFPNYSLSLPIQEKLYELFWCFGRLLFRSLAQRARSSQEQSRDNQRPPEKPGDPLDRPGAPPGLTPTEAGPERAPSLLLSGHRHGALSFL